MAFTYLITTVGAVCFRSTLQATLVASKPHRAPFHGDTFLGLHKVDHLIDGRGGKLVAIGPRTPENGARMVTVLGHAAKMKNLIVIGLLMLFMATAAMVVGGYIAYNAEESDPREERDPRDPTF